MISRSKSLSNDEECHNKAGGVPHVGINRKDLKRIFAGPLVESFDRGSFKALEASE